MPPPHRPLSTKQPAQYNPRPSLVLNNTGWAAPRSPWQRGPRPAGWSTGLLSARSIGRWYSVSISRSAQCLAGEGENKVGGRGMSDVVGPSTPSPESWPGEWVPGTLPKPVPRFMACTCLDLPDFPIAGCRVAVGRAGSTMAPGAVDSWTVGCVSDVDTSSLLA